jgi:disulfide bond formation protein DsbB
LGAAEANDSFGDALARGDFNGDGEEDLAVGVPFEDIDGISGAGAVNVLYGSGSGLTDVGDQLWHQDTPGIQGTAEAFDDFGRALASGDFNGDGVEDLAVGVRFENIDGITNAGAVNVLYGSGGGLTDVGDQLWHQDSPGILGAAESSDLFGRALASGDFDGDGADDLAVGVPGEDIDGTLSAGAVNVLYGTAPPPTPTATPTATPTPTTPAGLVGDVDCDGSVTSIDAALILQLIAGFIASLPCQDAADVNEDGMITAVDATLILQFVAGLIGTLPP